MSPPLLDVEGVVQGNISSLSSESSMDSSQTGLKERNYLGLSDNSSIDSSVTILDHKSNLNLKATELRLGLPDPQSPEPLDEKPFFPLVPSKDSASSNKRGFSDTINSSVFTEGNWMFKSTGSDTENPKFAGQIMKNIPAKGLQEMIDTNNGAAPAAKAQVVGWPPIRSFRKNTLATNSKTSEEVDGKPGRPVPHFVKVSMDGAPYLRKVDLGSYSSYKELSSALQKMFSFTLGQCKEILSETKLRDISHASEYVTTYEDKDGDWMLVGDVPWEMFAGSCKRLKIMKGSDAIGLSPRAMEKAENKI